MSGHYTATICDNVNSVRYHCNDAEVDKVFTRTTSPIISPTIYLAMYRLVSSNRDSVLPPLSVKVD